MPETDKILSQHEVDALLSAIDSGQAGDSRADSSAEPYDFRRPSRIPPGPLRFLHSMHESLARALQSAMSGMLMRPVETRLAGIHQLPLGEFVASQPHPAVLILLSAEPLEGTFLMSISPSIMFPFVERLLGAGKVTMPQRDRALSPLEWNVADALTSRLLDLLREAWAPLAPAKFAVMRRENDPTALKSDSANEPSVAVTFEVAMGDQRGALEVVFPSLAVEPYFPNMVSATGFSTLRDPGAGREEAISKRLAPAEVEVEVHLPQESARLKDLERLAPGDVLVTSHAQAGLVYVTVEGRKKFLARLGSLKDRKAVKVIAPAGEPPSPSRDRTWVMKAEGAAPAAGPEPILALPLPASVVLAEKEMKVREVLALRPGEVLEFPKRPEEPLEFRVSGRAVAEGTAVRLGEHFGIRLTGMRPPGGR